MTDLPFPVFTADNLPEAWPEGLEGAVFLLDKPLGWSSFRLVGLIRKLLGIRKVGHAGTLDPLATGVLIVAVGRATKQIDRFMAEDKRYEAHIRFGYSTPSYDSETEPDETAPWEHITAAAVDAVLTERFIGFIEQVPPVFSAIKINGVPAYKKARIGQQVSVKPRLIHIQAAHIIHAAVPDVVLDIRCGKGTYIRSLAHDLGRALDSRATLVGLIRTESGPWRLSSAIGLQTLLRTFDPDGKTGLPR
jgi:tRNA pseudouridine55 synthase